MSHLHQQQGEHRDFNYGDVVSPRHAFDPLMSNTARKCTEQQQMGHHDTLVTTALDAATSIATQRSVSPTTLMPQDPSAKATPTIVAEPSAESDDNKLNLSQGHDDDSCEQSLAATNSSIEYKPSTSSNEIEITRTKRIVPFSYSAPAFSDKDEECELAGLTECEKQNILDDIYGRNTANHTNNTHGEEQRGGTDDDITEEVLDGFFDALEAMPFEQKEDYLFVLDNFPHLIRTESNPKRFLRSTGYNPKLAALRLIEYWKVRLELFEGYAFDPLTVSGAMSNHADDMLLMPNLVRILPDDEHGRTVICYDKTGINNTDFDERLCIKMLWLVTHIALQKESAQKNGLVFIVIKGSLDWDGVSCSTLRLAVKSFDECLPVKVGCIHFVCTSALFRLFVPTVKYFMKREARRRIQLHSSIAVPTTLKEFESFGLHRDGLPKSIGGHHDEIPMFIKDCKCFVEQRRRGRKRRANRF